MIIRNAFSPIIDKQPPSQQYSHEVARSSECFDPYDQYSIDKPLSQRAEPLQHETYCIYPGPRTPLSSHVFEFSKKALHHYTTMGMRSN